MKLFYFFDRLVIATIWKLVVNLRQLNLFIFLKLFMKLLIVLFISLPSIIFCQTKEDTTASWFKYIYEIDGKMTKKAQEFMLKDIYTTNLNIISTQIKEGALTNKLISVYNKNTNNYIRSGIDMTYWHILKYNPSLILNAEYINFIENEIKNNDFDKKLLINMFQTYYRIFLNSNLEKNQDKWEENIKHEFDALFYEAIKRWEIEDSILKSTEIN